MKSLKLKKESINKTKKLEEMLSKNNKKTIKKTEYTSNIYRIWTCKGQTKFLLITVITF